MEEETEQNKAMTESPDKDARNWAMICHLSGLTTFVIPLGNVLGPLIVWAIKKNDHPFIDDQGKEALNFQLTMTICILAAGAMVILLIGFLLIPVIYLFILIMIIIASINSNDGKYFRYPLTIRFFK